jgi:hypothetical protein
MPRRKKFLKMTPDVLDSITRSLAGGCTRQAAYGAAKIAKRTFYDWLRDSPEFKQVVEDAENQARLAIEARLARLAVDGDRFAIMYWLQNRYPDDWKDTRNYKIDQNLAIQEQKVEEATDDEILDMLEKEGIDVSEFRRATKTEDN